MGEWSNGLLGCFGDCGTCIITYFVPCLTAGKNAEAVGEGCCLYGFLSILGPIGIWSRAKIRGKIRESKGIDGGFGMDCILHWFCGLCALIQEARNLLRSFTSVTVWTFARILHNADKYIYVYSGLSFWFIDSVPELKGSGGQAQSMVRE